MYKLYFSFLVITASMLSVFASGCKSNSSSPTGPSASTVSSTTVTIVNFSFSPGIDTVAVHTTVTWNNTSGTTHTSTSNTGVWDTGDISGGSSKTTTFDSPGVYPYHCSHHSSMVGVIYVH
jgi:plastocyanin